MNTSYLRYELLRAVRNRRFFVFAFGFPLILFYLIAGPNRNESSLGGSGIPAPLYYMIGLAAFGSMNAMVATGARISAERSSGWNRQLRITPLSTSTYFRAKVVIAYLVAFASLLVLFVAGITLGVSMPAQDWVTMTALMLVGLLPFAALGILIGHLFTPDTIGPVIGGGVALFALLGGTWFPITRGLFKEIAQCLPSYWLVQASHVSIGGASWGSRGWIVIAVWTVGLSLLAARAYRRDTKRV